MTEKEFQKVRAVVMTAISILDVQLQETEKKLFLMEMIPMALHQFGYEQIKKMLDLLVLDGVGDCPDRCRICNPNISDWTSEDEQYLAESVGLGKSVLDDEVIE